MIGPAPPQIGGMETFVGELMHSSLVQKYRVLLLDIAKPRVNQRASFKAVTGYANSFRRNVLISLTSYGYSFIFLLRFLGALFTQPVQIIHIHTASYTSFWEKMIYIRLGRLFRKKIVLHIHGAKFQDFIDGSRPFIKDILISHLKKCDRIIVLSDSWKKYFSWFLPDAKIHVVENGIDPSPFAKVEIARSKQPLIVYLGEVGKRKGIYDLLPAFAIMKKNGIDFRALIIGPGEVEMAGQRAVELAIADRVDFVGPRRGEEKIRLLKQGWCFVLPSYAEGFPIAILEALAAGLPIVSTRVGGIPDMIREGENGFLVDPADKDALADRLTKLVADRQLWLTISKNNIAKAHNTYSINACAEKITRIYDELL